MRIARLRPAVPGIALITGLMAMALSCGGAAESPASMTASDSARPQTVQESAPAAAEGPAGRPASQSQSTSERVETRSTAREQVQNQVESAPAQPAATAAPMAASGDAFDRSVADQQASDGQDSLQPQSGRQLIVEAWVSLEVNEIDAIVRQVETVAVQRGGWIESADIVGEGGYRVANINVRVPAERFNNAMETLRALGRVTDEGVSSTDVTDRLIDNEARMMAWRVQEERLIVLLENAATVEDVIDIERRISEVRADIEHVAATQRSLNNRVAASLIRVSLHLPQRFAADPPRGSLSLSVGDPGETANVVANQVTALNGYIGEKRDYQEGRGQVVEMTVFVRSTDLAGLMDYAATLGEPSDRRLDSVGPAQAGDVPDARLVLMIRSNVDSAATLALSAAQPIQVAGEIRARAESLGGYVESWNETRWDNGEQQNVNTELVVRASDLRALMEFGATLGEAQHWEFRSIGQAPSDAAPNSRLTISVYSDEGSAGGALLLVVVIVVVVAGLAVLVAAVALVSRRRRRGALATTLMEDPQTQ